MKIEMRKFGGNDVIAFIHEGEEFSLALEDEYSPEEMQRTLRWLAEYMPKKWLAKRAA